MAQPTNGCCLLPLVALTQLIRSAARKRRRCRTSRLDKGARLSSVNTCGPTGKMRYRNGSYQTSRGAQWGLRRTAGASPYASADADTLRIWWTYVGIHQNLTFPVHPDPVSGQHCWHQAVRVRKAEPDDRPGDVRVDTAKAHEIYQSWLDKTRPASTHSPDGTRRPFWLLRPLKPPKNVFLLP